MFFYALSRFVVNRLSGILPSLDTLSVVGLIVMAPARLGRTLIVQEPYSQHFIFLRSFVTYE